MANKKNTATENALGELHATVAKVLMEQIKSGDGGTAVINAAIKFLKDNNISCSLDDSDDLVYLAKEVPTFITVEGEEEL